MEQYLQLYENYEITDFDLVRIHLIKNNNTVQESLINHFNAFLCSCLAFINNEKKEFDNGNVMECMDLIHNGVSLNFKKNNSSEKANSLYNDAVVNVSIFMKKLLKIYGKDRTESIYYSVIFDLIELKNVPDEELRDIVAPESSIKKFVKSNKITVLNFNLSAA